MPPARFGRIAFTGFVLLGACNDTRDLAPASPDTPWQFEASKEAPTAPAPATVEARRFAVPENTAVQLPSPADIDPNHVYSLVELIDIAQRRNPATRVAWEQARQAAINVGTPSPASAGASRRPAAPARAMPRLQPTDRLVHRGRQPFFSSRCQAEHSTMPAAPCR